MIDPEKVIKAGGRDIIIMDGQAYEVTIRQLELNDVREAVARFCEEQKNDRGSAALERGEP